MNYPAIMYRENDFSVDNFDDRTVIICDQVWFLTNALQFSNHLCLCVMIFISLVLHVSV